MPKWDLSLLTTGERSALRRAAGSLSYNVAARRAFYRADLSGDERYEDIRYAAMCFACIWRADDGGEVLPMETCLRRLCHNSDGTIAEGMAARVDALLETSWGRDDYLAGKLLNLMKILHGNGGIIPDFEKLAEDLTRWNWDNRPVQRRWLRAIYRSDKDEKNEEEQGHDA